MSVLFDDISENSKYIVIDINGHIKIVDGFSELNPGDVFVYKGDSPMEVAAETKIGIIGDDGEIQNIDDEIEQIFAQLERGQDPTQLSEAFAPAAGTTNTSSSNEGTTTVERTAAESQGSTAFDTSAEFNSANSTSEESALSSTQRLSLERYLADPTAIDDAFVTDEDQPVTMDVLANDSDANNDTLTLTAATVPAGQGTVEIVDGNLVFTPAANYFGVATITYTVDDGNNGSTTATATVVVNSVNDAPVAVDGTNSTEENTILEGNVPAATDIDGTIASYQLVSDVSEGALTLNTDGSYSFNPGTEFDDLAEGETREVTFTYTATDNGGLVSDVQTVAITVTGSNDAPVLTVNNLSATEDGSAVIGTPSFVDPDTNDSGHTFSVTAMPEGQGSVSIDANTGEYTYNPGNDFQNLALNETATVSFDVTVDDGKGGTDTETVTVTVKGTNDDPVLTVNSLNADEDGGEVKGTPSFTDPDIKDSGHTFSVTAMPEGQGSVSINASTGEYTYNPGSDFQSLEMGETTKVSFNVTVYDGNGGSDTETVIVTITGTNDKPTIETETRSVTEDKSIRGRMDADDVDLGKGAELTFSTSKTVKGLTLNEDGTYRFDASEYDSLEKGETQTITVPVTVTDEHGAKATSTLEITITGTNDKPTIETETRSVTEDKSIRGRMDADDVDLGKGAELTFSTSKTVKGLTLNDDGTYRFDASEYDSLEKGEIQTITVPVTVTDEHGAKATSTLEITITGTNDKPTIETETRSVTEDKSIRGRMDADDVDLGKGAELTFSTSKTVKGLTLNDDGTYRFDASEYDSLEKGEIRTITVPVTVTDEHGAKATSTLEITITGTNDKPTIETETRSVTEDKSIRGRMDADDVDLGKGAELTFSTSKTVKGLTLNEDGTYRFDASEYDSLEKGETQTITVPVTVTDEHGAKATSTLEITITGTNDKPTIETETRSVTEDKSIRGRMDADDVDLGKGAELTFSTSKTVKGLTLNEDGTYRFDASEYDSLEKGEIQTITVPVTVTDEHGAKATSTLEITITGTNDKPTIETETRSVTEDKSIRGRMDADDVDLGKGAELTFSTSKTVKGLTLNDDGTYRFDASEYDSLEKGEIQTITVPVTVTDEHGAKATSTLEITITGTNDKPTIETETRSVTEDKSIRGRMDADDVDLGKGAELTFSTSKTVKGLTLNEDGTYRFDASEYDSLEKGEIQTITVPVTVTDEHGAKATSTLEITITGTNDKPTIETETRSVTEDKSIRGRMDADDVDLGKGAELTFSTSKTVKGLTLNEDGTYRFDASEYDSLEKGEIQTITVPVTVTDEHGAKATSTLEITITGTNDKPTIETETRSVTEDKSIRGRMDADDVDLGKGAELTFSTSKTVKGLTLNDDGTYRFDASEYDSLEKGEIQTITVPVTVTDEHGAKATSTLEITITGTNDKPTIETETRSVTEDKSIRGRMDADDVDLGKGAELTFSTSKTVKGLTLNEDGTYRFDASEYDSLEKGEIQTITVPVTVTDEHGAKATSTLEITITGTNDKPTIETETRSVTEDKSIRGRMDADDVDLGKDAELTFSTSKTVKGLTLNDDGTYRFDASEYDSLEKGEIQTITVPVTVTDEHGAKATSTLEITITGTNDKPTIETETRSVTEDKSIRGRMDADDVDLGKGAELTFSTSKTVKGLTLNDDGTYRFDASEYDSLEKGEIQTITVPVTVTDEHGAKATSNLEITITGTNDGPVAVDDADKVLFTESFETSGLSGNSWGEFGNYNGWTITDKNGKSAELEIQSGNVGGSSASEGNAHAELDAHGPNSLVKISRELDTEPKESYELSFDYKPRPGSVNDSNMKVTFGSTSLLVVASKDAQGATKVTVYDIDENGNRLGVAEDVTVTYNEVTGWYSVSVTGVSDSDATTTLSFAGEGQQNSLGAYLDNIEVKEATLTTSEDAVLNISVADVLLGNDTDVDGDKLSIVKVDDKEIKVGETIILDSGALLTLRSDGTYDYNPNGKFDHLSEGERATDTFEYTVDDGNQGTDTATVTITLTGTNDAPTIEATKLEKLEEGSVSEGTLVATFKADDLDDADVKGLTYQITSGNEDGYFQIDADGRVTLTAKGAAAIDNDKGTDITSLELGVKSYDGKHYSDEIKVEIDVDRINDNAPRVISYGSNHELVEGTWEAKAGVHLASFRIEDIDDQDTLTYRITSNNDDGYFQIDEKTGVVTLTAKGADAINSDEGKDITSLEVKVVASDGQHDTREMAQSFKIIRVNDNEPTIEVTDVKELTEGSVKKGTLVATFKADDLDDSDVKGLTYEITSGNEQGYFRIDAKTGDVTLTAKGAAAIDNDKGTDITSLELGVKSYDGKHYSDEIKVEIDVNRINDNAPVIDISDGATETNIVVNEDHEFVSSETPIIVTDLDDGDSLTYEILDSDKAANGSVSIDPVTGKYTYNPNEDFSGKDSFKVTVTDGNGAKDTVVINVNVKPVNDNPVADDFSIASDQTFSFGSTESSKDHVTDPDSEQLAINISEADGPKYGELKFFDSEGKEVDPANVNEFTEVKYEKLSDADITAKLSFDAKSLVEDDKFDVVGQQSAEVTSTGVTISSHQYSGAMPDGEPTDTETTITYKQDQTKSINKVGLGVDSSDKDTPEMDVTGKEYISVDYTGANAEITSAKFTFSSLGNYYDKNDTSAQEAQVNILAISTTGEPYLYTFNDKTNDVVFDGSGDFSVVINAPEGVSFDEFRVFTTQSADDADGIDASTKLNSNMLLQGVEVISADVSDSFKYEATDSDGAVSNEAEVTIDTIEVNSSMVSGLKGEYFTYHDNPGNNVAQKDYGNNLRNVSGALNYLESGDENDADAIFTSTGLSYKGNNGQNLGGENNLEVFLGTDSASLSKSESFENSADAIVRMSGAIELTTGFYAFKVTADDGYSIKVNGEVVAQFDGNQGPTMRHPDSANNADPRSTHVVFEVEDAGYQDIEIVYWDQGGRYELDVELANFGNTKPSVVTVQDFEPISSDILHHEAPITDATIGSSSVVFAGVGQDILTGGEGDDTFIWTTESLDNGTTDTIRDFTVGEDSIDISELLDLSDDQNLPTNASDLGDLLNNIQVDEAEGDVSFNITNNGNTQTIVIEDVVSQLDSLSSPAELTNELFFNSFIKHD
ncbi:VCBS domain-containing protein [Vibrio sp. HN007]|uniref:VCBS domain-containing protein n=1 Tax=Vibrio iocasae TaxID=3098914 RepID=UPI0035D442E2